MDDDKRFALNREMQLVAFKVGREEFGVDVKKVEGVISLVDVTRMPRAPEFVEGIINLRGKIVAVVDLASRLGIETSDRTSKTRIVVVEARDVKVGLVVDTPEVINIRMEDVEASPTLTTGDIEASFIRGVVKLDDRLLILLDVDRVLSEEERSGIGEIEAAGEEERGTQSEGD